MNYLILVGAIFLVFILMAQSHSIYTYSDPKHCRVYGACYAIGYNDGYSDAQNGNTRAYACMGHSTVWCDGSNEVFRAGIGGSDISYGQGSDQLAHINISGVKN